MADCTLGIALNIVSDCSTQPIAGTEVKAWIGNRADATFTYDVTVKSKVTNIAIALTKKLFTITGVKKLLNPASSRVVTETRADRFIHKFSFEGFEITAESTENLDNLSDIFVIVEMKQKEDAGNGTIRGFGLQNGMYVTTDEWTANDNDGARPITVESMATSPEKHHHFTILKTDYATTIAMLEALEVVQV